MVKGTTSTTHQGGSSENSHQNNSTFLHRIPTDPRSRLIDGRDYLTDITSEVARLETLNLSASDITTSGRNDTSMHYSSVASPTLRNLRTIPSMASYSRQDHLRQHDIFEDDEDDDSISSRQRCCRCKCEFERLVSHCFFIFACLAFLFLSSLTRILAILDIVSALFVYIILVTSDDIYTNIWDAFTDELKHYSIKTSMSDILIISFIRSIILFFVYAYRNQLNVRAAYIAMFTMMGSVVLSLVKLLVSTRLSLDVLVLFTGAYSIVEWLAYLLLRRRRIERRNIDNRDMAQVANARLRQERYLTTDGGIVSVENSPSDTAVPRATFMKSSLNSKSVTSTPVDTEQDQYAHSTYIPVNHLSNYIEGQGKENQKDVAYDDKRENSLDLEMRNLDSMDRHSDASSTVSSSPMKTSVYDSPMSVDSPENITPISTTTSTSTSAASIAEDIAPENMLGTRVSAGMVLPTPTFVPGLSVVPTQAVLSNPATLQLADSESRFVRFEGTTVHYKVHLSSNIIPALEHEKTLPTSSSALQSVDSTTDKVYPPIVVLLHGFGGGIFSFSELIQHLLPHTSAILAFDRPGFGLTSRATEAEVALWTRARQSRNEKLEEERHRIEHAILAEKRANRATKVGNEADNVTGMVPSNTSNTSNTSNASHTSDPSHSLLHSPHSQPSIHEFAGLDIYQDTTSVPSTTSTTSTSTSVASEPSWNNVSDTAASIVPSLTFSGAKLPVNLSSILSLVSRFAPHPSPYHPDFSIRFIFAILQHLSLPIQSCGVLFVGHHSGAMVSIRAVITMNKVRAYLETINAAMSSAPLYRLPRKPILCGLTLISPCVLDDGIPSVVRSLFRTQMGKSLIQQLVRSEIGDIALQRGWYNPKRIPVEVTKNTKAVSNLPNWVDGLMNIAALPDENQLVESNINTVTTPTFLIYGEQDKITVPTTTLKLAREFVNATSLQLTKVEECGHNPHQEQVEFTSRAIEKFIKTLYPNNNNTQQVTASSNTNETSIEMPVDNDILQASYQSSQEY